MTAPDGRNQTRPFDRTSQKHGSTSDWHSVADLIREAIRTTFLRPGAEGPVALWDGAPKQTSVKHDSIYDEP